MPRIRWTAVEPAHLEIERGSVLEAAPDLKWRAGMQLGNRTDLFGFEGPLPPWCADRIKPVGVDELLSGARLIVRCVYTEATPMVPPSIVPLDPQVPIKRRTDHSWHVNGDGSLCLLRAAGDWVPGSTARPLIVKASCWFIEYLLKERGLIDAMSERGIADDSCFDDQLASLAT